MRAVTFQELANWLKANKHRTWHFSGFKDPTVLTLEIKYLDFSIDTRDMTVWRLSVRGLGGDVVFRDTSDDGDKTILDGLEELLDKRSQSDKNEK